MREADLLADLFEQGRIDEIGPRLTQLGDRDAIALSVFAALKDRGNLERGVNFLITYANGTPAPTETLYDLAERLSQADEKLAAANLFMIYVNAGGANPLAYDAALTFAMRMGMPDLCIEVYEKAKRIGIFGKLMGSTLFNVGTIFMNQSRFDEAAELYGVALQRDPGDPSLRKNLTALAREHGIPRAIQYLDHFLQNISRSYPAPPVDAARQDSADCQEPFLLSWESTTLDAVRAAVIRHGFCLIRNACHLDRIHEFHAAVLGYEARSGLFPLAAEKIPEPPIEEIYRFDARRLVSDVFGAPGALDIERSVVRRVTPSQKDSFVPFHQDSTAFAAALVNIWTPLTPAGGDYPSLELVAQRVTEAEQTLIRDGEYNRVEIASDYVLDRYKGRVYEVADAQPGDCVIFLGTTIHRSANLSGAVKPRYGLEARWKPSD